MCNNNEEKYEIIERLRIGAKYGDKESMEELIKRIEPLIISSCKHYFGYIDEDLFQQGILKFIMLLHEFDAKRGVKFLGYIKKMLNCYFWDLKKENLKLVENEVSITQENERYINDRCFAESGYAEVEIDDLLNALTEKERYIIIRNVMEKRKLVDIAREMGINYDYAKTIKKSALSKLIEIISIYI